MQLEPSSLTPTILRLVLPLLALCLLLVAAGIVTARTLPLAPVLAYLTRDSDGRRLTLLDLQRDLSLVPGLALPPVLDMAWSPDGRRLAVITQDSVIAFDTAALTQAGQRISISPTENHTSLAWLSGDRIAVWNTIPFARIDEITLIDLTAGTVTPLPLPREVYGSSLVWSPDRRQIAFTSPDQEAVLQDPNAYADAEIYLLDFDGMAFGTARRLTENRVDDEALVWSPDGRRLAFVTYLEAHADIVIMDPGAPQTLERVTTSVTRDTNPTWSPDGLSIAYDSGRGGDPSDILIALGVEDGYRISMGYGTSIHDRRPQWSPDGDYIVFQNFFPGLQSAALYLVQRNPNAPNVFVTDELVRETALDTVPRWRP